MGEVATEQHPTSIASPKIDMLVSKVGPSSIKNNPKWPHLHEKLFNIIISNLLRKHINRGRKEERGGGGWTLWDEEPEKLSERTKERRERE